MSEYVKFRKTQLYAHNTREVISFYRNCQFFKNSMEHKTNFQLAKIISSVKHISYVRSVKSNLVVLLQLLYFFIITPTLTPNFVSEFWLKDSTLPAKVCTKEKSMIKNQKAQPPSQKDMTACLL